VEKVNVTLPKETLAKLRRFIPAGERSHVIAEATAQYLEGVTQQAAIRQTAGLWKDRVSLRSQADVNRALKRLRGSTRRRLKRLASRG
jgi:metal-responsive CopG/Arc/MetJ family transcriptional regulator